MQGLTIKQRVVSGLLVVAVSFFSFSFARAQEVHTTHTPAVAEQLVTSNYQVTQTGSSEWKSAIEAPADSTVSWLLSYTHAGGAQVNQLQVSVSLPMYHTVVPGSVTWFDGNNPEGYELSDTGLINEGVQLGSVVAGGNGFVRFRTTVDRNVPCSITSLSSASFIADGSSSIHQATYSSPACPQTVDTPVIQTPQVDSHTHNAVAPPITSATTINTTAQSSVANTTSSSGQVAVAHTEHIPETAPTPATTPSNTPANTSQPVVVHESHTSTPAPAPAPAPTTTHTTHSSPAPTPQVQAVTTHSGHTATTSTTIPETGASPFIVMIVVFTIGYISRLYYFKLR